MSKHISVDVKESTKEPITEPITEPARRIPKELLKDYSMNYSINVFYHYSNDSIDKGSNVWSDDLIENYLLRFRNLLIKNSLQGNEPYGNASLFHVMAFEKYSMVDLDVAVIGSLTPWIESILLNNGAKTVTTVEYNVPVCNYPKIKTISYKEFTESSHKYDAICSYSSIEHSGLGRYGDELNPNGDIETINFINKHLKDKGLLFLGIPIGKDAITWNIHRVYGNKRLKLLLENFIEIEWIGIDKSYIDNCPIDINGPQPLIVLQKAND